MTLMMGTSSPISTTITQVSCGSATNILGVDAAGHIYKYTGSGTSWTQIAGGLKQVSVAADGTVWGVAATGTVFRYRGSQANSWEQMPGGLAQVSVGSASLVWGVTADGTVFRYRGDQARSWEQIPGQLKQVSVASDGTVWGVDSNGLVYQYVNNARTQMSSNVLGGSTISFTQVIVVAANFVEGLDAQGNCYGYNSTGLFWEKNEFPLARYFSFAGTADQSGVFIDLQGTSQAFSAMSF